MQTYTTETSITRELLEGEELLWSGRSRSGGRSVKSPARGLFIAGLAYCVLGFIVIIVGLVLNIAFSSPDGFNPFFPLFIFGGIFAFIGLIVLCIGYFGRFTPKNTFYAITDRHVIILRGGRHLHAISYGKRAISQVQRFERPDGSGDLIFASSPTIPNVYATSINNNMYNNNRQGAFTAIANVRQVEQKLLRMLQE